MEHPRMLLLTLMATGHRHNRFSKITYYTGTKTTSIQPLFTFNASSTTNNTGLFFGTSTADNYGISLNGWRKLVNGSSHFAIKTHDNSASGTTRFYTQTAVGIGTESPENNFQVDLGTNERVLFHTTAAPKGAVV